MATHCKYLCLTHTSSSSNFQSFVFDSQKPSLRPYAPLLNLIPRNLLLST